jgi:ribonuclease HI
MTAKRNYYRGIFWCKPYFLRQILQYYGYTAVFTAVIVQLFWMTNHTVRIVSSNLYYWQHCKILIYTDNQAAIQTIERPRCRSGLYLLAEIIEMLEVLRPKTRYIEISWIPAHTGIPGNEAADLAAKEATGWRNSNHGPKARPSAPPRQLYSLKSTLITWIKQTAISRWTTE